MNKNANTLKIIGTAIGFTATAAATAAAVLYARKSKILAEESLKYQTRNPHELFKEQLRSNLRNGLIGVDAPEFLLPGDYVERKECSLLDVIESGEKGVYHAGGKSGEGKSTSVDEMLHDSSRPVVHLQFQNGKYTQQLQEGLGIDISEEYEFTTMLHDFASVLNEDEFCEINPIVIAEDVNEIKIEQDLADLNHLAIQFYDSHNGTMIYIGSDEFESFDALSRCSGFTSRVEIVEYNGLDENSLLNTLEKIGYSRKCTEVLLLYFGGCIRRIRQFYHKYGIAELEIVEEGCIKEEKVVAGRFKSLHILESGILDSLAKDGHCGVEEVSEKAENAIEILIETLDYLYYSLERQLIPKSQIIRNGVSTLVDYDYKGDLIKRYRNEISEEFLKGYFY